MKYPDRSHDLTSLCMHYVLLLRSIAFWGPSLILWALTYKLQQPFPIKPVGSVLITLGIITIISWVIAIGRKVVSDKFVFCQLLIDILMLSWLLFLTGGSLNPFVTLLILPVTFAAAMLRPVFIWIIVGTAMLAYTLLMYFHNPMALWEHHGDGFTLHVWGMWAGFLLSAGLVAYFVSRIGNTLKARDQLLAKAREQALKSEKIVALGTLAAGTAHELGTPLSTIAIIAKDLEKETQEETPRISKKLGLLRGQVERCKEILSKMAASTGQLQADAGEPVTVDTYLEDILEEWLATRPEVAAESDFEGTEPAPRIIADRTVTQAIMNILNNAADASTDLIKIKGRWDHELLNIQVQDSGTGLPVDLKDKIGEEPFLSTKPSGKGLGLGLYLAKNTLGRLGGKVLLKNRSNNDGVTAELTLPLTQLLTHE